MFLNEMANGTTKQPFRVPGAPISQSLTL